MKNSRRNFLQLASLGIMGAAISPVFSARTFANTGTNAGNKTVVKIFLRGGADGLHILPPTGPNNSESQLNAYKDLRSANDGTANHPGTGFFTWADRQFMPDLPSHARPLELDGKFELNPALIDLYNEFWQDGNGDMAIFPGTGNSRSGSHFIAQDAIEWAVPAQFDNQKSTGWMHDALQQMDPGIFVGKNAGAISFGPSISKSLGGIAQSEQIFAMSDANSFNFDLTESELSIVRKAFSSHEPSNPHNYRGASDQYLGVKQTLLRSFDLSSALEALPPIDISNFRFNRFPVNDEFVFENRHLEGFARQLAGTASIINQGDAPLFFNINVGGWDTHSNVYPGTNFSLQALNTAVREFFNILTPASRDTTLVMIGTEFGRTLDINGNNGTDHGQAGTWMLLGGCVNGGVYNSDLWKGLPISDFDSGMTTYIADNNLSESLTLRGNRPVQSYNTDYREIYRSVLEQFFNIGDTKPIFNIAPESDFDFGIIPNLF